MFRSPRRCLEGRGQKDPAIDLRALAQPTVWPEQLTAGLIGAYVVPIVVGALLFPLVSRWSSPRITLIGCAFLVGYMVVWAICGAGALVAEVLLLLVPKLALANLVSPGGPRA